ncbi:phosphoribosyl-AMP cyclohydrolase [bacterium SCSIO 12696]|nr:phosphoribosyl-AMP cyclohydrolase [bacterium SCSIO 12696]
MKNHYFQSLEPLQKGQKVALADILDKLAVNDQGLIPVVTQDAITKDVLMLAWMNKTSIEQTLSTGLMTYWSRSRNQFWIKGETSGHFQKLQSMRLDCDGDTILCLVNQEGPACHTGRSNCFYLQIDDSEDGTKAAVSLLSSPP